MSSKNLKYWKNKLEKRLPVLEITTDNIRSSNQEYRAGIETFTFSQELSQSLIDITQKHEVNLLSTLLTAFNCLLYRYTTQEDIIVGSYIPKTDNSDFNTLALRNYVSGNCLFSQLLKQTFQVVSLDLQHQDFEWEQLVKQLPSLDAGIFQVIFNLQDAAITDTPLPINLNSFELDLSWFLVSSKEELKGTIAYNQELFEPQTIKRMIGHFSNLLEAIVLNPDTLVNELTILNQVERHQILVEWNQTEFEYPTDKCIHQLFEEQVAKTPDAVALIWKDQQLTYQQLDNRANQLANYLLSLEVKPDVLVGICIDRCLEMIVGILGILKAGGAYVPLDPAYPQERLSHMLEDSGVEVLLTTENLLSQIPENNAQQICLDKDWDSLIAIQNEQAPQTDVSPSNLAYIIYTSGSTGKSKGVMIEHNSLVNFTATATKEYGINHQDRILQFASISFDVAAEEMYPCLTSGATLILRTDDFITNGSEMLQKCDEWKLTVIDLPTAYWHQIVSDLANYNCDIPDSLRLVIIGGEAVIPEKFRTWYEFFKNKQSPEFINVYGPTEATVVVTKCKLSESINQDTGLPEMTIGRPFGNVKIYILDSCLNPVPIGVPGELHIGGVSLARGYLNRPELTTQKFITDPFNPGMRMYKSGDLARFLPDGNIDFLGRIDHQVKIRGFRIELGEIETVLNQHSSIKQAIVIPQEYDAGDKRLIAYVVPNSQVATTQQLKDFLKTKLPDYMVPSGFVFLDALPLTPNDKVDRKALPLPDKNNLNLQQDYLAANNHIEQKLVELWEKAFGIHPIGIKDDFFDLGGNSLMATLMVGEIEKLFDTKLNQAIFFEASTIEQLAAIIGQKETFSENVVKINHSGKKTPLFIISNTSFLYREMLEHLDTEQPIYIIKEKLAKASEMASACLQHIRSIQPNGPYYLMGHSYEGLVSYEIATKLHELNEQVAFLGMLDTAIPEVENRARDKTSWYKRYQRLKTVFQLPWKDMVNFFKERIDYRLSKKFYPLLSTLDTLTNEHEIKCYPGKITVFSALYEFYRIEDINLGWDKWVSGGIEIHEIPGTHRSILLRPDNAKLLAQKVNDYLIN